MKTNCFLLVLCLMLCIKVSSVSAQIHYITEEHGQARDSVKRYGKGDTLLVQYDSVYLFNRTQVRYYELLMKLKVTVSKDNQSLEKLFTELRNSLTMNLAELDNLSKDMKANADSTSRVGIKLVQTTLDGVSKSNTLLDASKIMLDSADAKLKRADLHLEQAHALVKGAKKRQWLERFMWGGGGVLAGIIAKGLFFK